MDDIIIALDGDDEIEVSSGNDFVDGGEGNDELIVDYSTSEEDLRVYLYNYLDGYSNNGYIEIYFPFAGNNNYIDFYSVESFVFNSGSGHDFIDMGYDNYSDDQVNGGAGDDVIFAGLGNDTIDGGTGLDVLRLDFAQSQTGVTSFLTDGNSGQYSDGVNTISFTNIESIDVMGSSYDDVLVAITGDSFNQSTMYPMGSWVDGFEGQDQLVADYSQSTEDLQLNLNSYGGSGSIDVYSNMSNYTSRIDFHNIESFAINSGSGHDNIELGYDNFSDDQVNAGAGDDFIRAGLGNDTIDGGTGLDVLRLDFAQSQTGVTSFLTDGNSG
ncbi:MAG: hypothetical protein AAF383_04845, partial [Cyanobacteria bacterium P01_A01_bin.83]